MGPPANRPVVCRSPFHSGGMSIALFCSRLRYHFFVHKPVRRMAAMTGPESRVVLLQIKIFAVELSETILFLLIVAVGTWVTIRSLLAFARTIL